VKALRFHSTGDLAKLAIEEMPTPAPGDDEVLVRIKAAGLNRSDVSNVMGGHPYTTLPRTPGRDFSGIVERGSASLLGKAVWGTGKEIGFTRDGSHGEYVLLPADGVALKPERLSFEEAASCGVPYVTAWHALESVHRGARLLVIGAAGAVGVAAVHLARMRGIDVTGAVRNVLPEDQRLPGEWDAIFDTTGHWLTPAIGALARHGRVIVIVAPGDGRPQVPIRDLYRRGASIVGVNSLLYSAADCARLFCELKPGFESGELRPPDALVTRPLSEGAQAYAALQRGQKGKLVIVP
jgi:NADPH:quinone reductase-like Zn-dependent oxidoreductase